jgi:hypothetical protein
VFCVHAPAIRIKVAELKLARENPEGGMWARPKTPELGATVFHSPAKPGTMVEETMEVKVPVDEVDGDTSSLRRQLKRPTQLVGYAVYALGGDAGGTTVKLCGLLLKSSMTRISVARQSDRVTSRKRQERFLICGGKKKCFKGESVRA